MKRVDRLYALTKPEPGHSGIRNYAFDRERLANLDKLRHDIIHGAGSETLIRDDEDDIRFLFQTGLHLTTLLIRIYDAKVNPLYFIGIEPPTRPTPTTLG